MRSAHSFFIPDEDSCRDVTGLVRQIAQKVLVDNQCLYCEHDSHKAYKAFGDVQNHMKDMGHCMINLEHLGEFRSHYDFTADNLHFIEKYFEKVTENVDEGYVEYKPKSELMNIHYKINERGEIEDWMDVGEDTDKASESFKIQESTESDLKASELSFKEMNSDITGSFRFAKAKIGDQILDLQSEYHFRDFMISNAQKTQIGELVLPNKKLIGNKEYAVYYNQTYPSNFLFNTEQLVRILEDKGVISTSDALVTYNYQELRKMYLTTIHNEKHADSEQIIAMNKLTEKFHKDRNTLKDRRAINTDIRHKTIFMKHLRKRE